MDRVAIPVARTILVSASAIALFAITSNGCIGDAVCCGACPESGRPAVFELSCDRTNLTSVSATGSCGMQDTNPQLYVGDQGSSIAVGGGRAGGCHVVLTFATGFTYSADMTFTAHSNGVCGGPTCTCPDSFVTTAGPFLVNNPSDTCVVSEPDAGDAGEAGDLVDAASDDGADALPLQCSDAGATCAEGGP